MIGARLLLRLLCFALGFARRAVSGWIARGKRLVTRFVAAIAFRFGHAREESESRADPECRGAGTRSRPRSPRRAGRPTTRHRSRRPPPGRPRHARAPGD